MTSGIRKSVILLPDALAFAAAIQSNEEQYMADNRTEEEQEEALNEQLAKAARSGDVSAIKRAIQEGAEVNSEYNPLIIAVRSNHADAIETLLDAGADIDERGDFDLSALSIAVCKLHKNIVKLLLEAGADVNGRNNFMTTPLHLARPCWNTGADPYAAINMLLAAGSSLDAKDEINATPIDFARLHSPQFFDYLQSIANDSSKRPTPESVGLDMGKRIAALEARGKPLGQFTQAERKRTQQRQTREAQRQEALDSPFGGI